MRVTGLVFIKWEGQIDDSGGHNSPGKLAFSLLLTYTCKLHVKNFKIFYLYLISQVKHLHPVQWTLTAERWQMWGNCGCSHNQTLLSLLSVSVETKIWKWIQPKPGVYGKQNLASTYAKVAVLGAEIMLSPSKWTQKKMALMQHGFNLILGCEPGLYFFQPYFSGQECCILSFSELIVNCQNIKLKLI